MFLHKSAQHQRVTSASRAQTEKPAPQRVNDASHDLESRADHHSKRATRSYDFDERVIIQIADNDDEKSELEHMVRLSIDCLWPPGRVACSDMAVLKIESDVSYCSCNEGNPHCQRCSDLFSDSDVSEAVEREAEADYGVRLPFIVPLPIIQLVTEPLARMCQSVYDYSPIQYISYETYTPPATNEVSHPPSCLTRWTSLTLWRLQDLFRTLSMDRRNLVLDSIDPEVAPHIVITPPPFDWNDCFTAYNMHPCPQNPGFLMVPQSCGWEMKAATPEPVEYVEPAQIEQEIDYAEMSCGEIGEIPDNEPLKVFSRSKFERQVCHHLSPRTIAFP